MTDEEMKAKGAKFDGGKCRLELIDPIAEEAMAWVLTYGSYKYTDNSWQKVDRERYIGAIKRHLNAIQRGEVCDPESGLPHAAHLHCNTMFLCHFGYLIS